MMPSSLKQCEGIDNSVNYHADEAIINIMSKEINTSKRINEILDKERLLKII